MSLVMTLTERLGALRHGGTFLLAHRLIVGLQRIDLKDFLRQNIVIEES